MELKREILNVPNSLSFSRIVLLPLLFFFTYLRWDYVFLISYILIGCTDYFDGKIARRLKQSSEFGKTIDSVADLFFYLGSLAFVYLWFPEIVAENKVMLVIFFVFFIASFAVSWIKLGKPILMHTNLLRLNAVLFFFLVVIAFLVEMLNFGAQWIPIYFATAIIVIYYLAFTEEIFIFLIYGDVDRDTRFIWHLAGKNKKE